MSLSSTLVAVGTLLHSKLQQDGIHDQQLLRRRTLLQHVQLTYLEDAGEEGKNALQKLCNSILKCSENNPRCRLFGQLMGWSDTSSTSSTATAARQKEETFVDLLLDVLTRTCNSIDLKEQLMDVEPVMVPLSLMKSALTFVFNGGLKHPQDLIQNDRCSSKLTKKLKMVCAKLSSDVKFGGEIMVDVFLCLESIRSEWLKHKQTIQPRLTVRPGFLYHHQQKKNNSTSKTTTMPTKSKKKAKPGEDEEGDSIVVHLWMSANKRLANTVQTWADSLRLHMWTKQWKAEYLPPKDILLNVPHPMEPRMHLLQLDVSYCCSFDDAALVHVATLCPHLRALKMVNNQLCTDIGLLHVAKGKNKD